MIVSYGMNLWAIVGLYDHIWSISVDGVNSGARFGPFLPVSARFGQFRPVSVIRRTHMISLRCVKTSIKPVCLSNSRSNFSLPGLTFTAALKMQRPRNYEQLASQLGVFGVSNFGNFNTDLILIYNFKFKFKSIWLNCPISTKLEMILYKF